jgi:hypothetical protein
LTRNTLEIGDSVKNYNNYTIHTMTPMFHCMDTFYMSTKTRRKDHIYCAGLILTPTFVAMGDVIKFYHFEAKTVIKHWCINILLVFLTNCTFLFIFSIFTFFDRKCLGNVVFRCFLPNSSDRRFVATPVALFRLLGLRQVPWPALRVRSTNPSNGKGSELYCGTLQYSARKMGHNNIRWR